MKALLRFLVVTGILGAVSAAAAAPHLIVSHTGALHPGEVVNVRWDDLPSRVEELEILFVRDDAFENIFRLTPQLVPRHGSVQWVVPNLPARDAVLRLRVGIDGKEIVVADSEPFAVAAATGAVRTEFRECEWWVESPARPQPVTGSGRNPTIGCDYTHTRFAKRPRPPHSIDQAEFAANGWSVPPPDSFSNHQHPRSRSPRVVPQRR